jgi:lysophospholipase L1-like esterase
VSVLGTLAALEIGARILLHFRGPVRAGSTFSEYGTYDPLLGWSKRPGAHVLFRRYEYSTDIAINSHGLRDKERAYEKPAGGYRVLALGDSYVEGFTVPLEKTVGQVLERSLGRGRCQVEVLNGGTTGYSTDQEDLFYENEGYRYDPDVVLLFFYYNDILANAMQQVLGGIYKPVFIFDGNAGVRLYKTPVKRGAKAPFSETLPEAPARSALVEWVQQRLWFGAPTLYNSIGRLGLWAPNRPIGAALELRVYSREDIPKLEDAWERTRRILLHLHAAVATRGGRFAIVYIPNNMEVDDGAWSYGKLRYEIDEAKWDRARVANRLKAIADSDAIPILDLTPSLREATAKVGRTFYQQDGHWNATGHETAAGSVAAFLRARGWAPPCATDPAADR